VYLLWQKNSDRSDGILANLALEEGEEKLSQVVDSIPLDPENVVRNCLTEFSAVWAYNP
jgi:hypothetical protein